MRASGGKAVFAFVCCACGWLLAGYYLLLHEAWQGEEEREALEESEERRQILEIENFMNAHRDMEGFGREVAGHQATALGAIPEELQQGEFMEFLQRLALRNHIELMGVIPGREIREGEAIALPVQVRFRCGYFQLLDFMKGLQSGERFLQVRNARISSDHGSLVCRLDIAIFAMRKT